MHHGIRAAIQHSPGLEGVKDKWRRENLNLRAEPAAGEMTGGENLSPR